jgi:uncharacterized protein (TIGR00369 family)
VGNDADAARCRAVCAKFAAAGYYKLLGMVPSSEAPGTARVSMPFRSELVQLYGAVHGGAILSVADAAVNLALATTLDEDESTSTIDLSLSFIAPPGARDVEAHGTLTKRGRRVSFAECVVTAGGEEIARAKAVLYVSKR